MTFNRMRAFEPGLHLAVHMDGRLAVADSTTYEVKLVDADGNVTGTVGRPIAPVAVTEEIKEAAKTRRLEALGAAAGVEIHGTTAVQRRGRPNGRDVQEARRDHDLRGRDSRYRRNGR